MIELTDVTKRYGHTTAVDHLSFEVRPGQVTGFLGPNGAGKSTTMRMIVGLDAPTSGKVTVDGHPYRDLRFPLHHVGVLLEARAIARNHRLRTLHLANATTRDQGLCSMPSPSGDVTGCPRRRAGGRRRAAG